MNPKSKAEKVRCSWESNYRSVRRIQKAIKKIPGGGNVCDAISGESDIRTFKCER